jgi:hypothetical protein
MATMNRSLLACLVVTFTASVAGADDANVVARAEALNAQGKARMQVVDFEGAAALFRSAIELVPDPRYYFNLCYTLDRAGNLREARVACEAVVASKADARLIEKARERLVAINQAIGDRAATPAATPSDGQAAATAPSPPPGTSPDATDASAGAPRTAVRPGHTYSIRLGVGASTIVGDGIDLDMIFAGALGGGAIVWLGPVAIQLEGLVARRGASVTFDGGSGSVTQTDTYTYVDLVTAARLEVGGGRVRPYGLGGLYGGLRLAATGELSDGTSVDVVGTSTFDLGLVVGGGAAFGGFRRAFSVDLRFQQGFVDLDESENHPKHRVFLLMAGYEI